LAILLLYRCRLVGPALLVDESFRIEPSAVWRLAGDVAAEPPHDVRKFYAALSAPLELSDGLRLSDLVGIACPKLLSKIARPIVRKRARARFFLLCFCLCLCLCLWSFARNTMRNGSNAVTVTISVTFLPFSVRRIRNVSFVLTTVPIVRSIAAVFALIEQPSRDQSSNRGGSLLLSCPKLEGYVSDRGQRAIILGCNAHEIEPSPSERRTDPLKLRIVNSLIICAPPSAHQDIPSAVL
jgi:hypothetical protein